MLPRQRSAVQSKCGDKDASIKSADLEAPVTPGWNKENRKCTGIGTQRPPWLRRSRRGARRCGARGRAAATCGHARLPTPGMRLSHRWPGPAVRRGARAAERYGIGASASAVPAAAVTGAAALQSWRHSSKANCSAAGAGVRRVFLAAEPHMGRRAGPIRRDCAARFHACSPRKRSIAGLSVWPLMSISDHTSPAVETRPAIPRRQNDRGPLPFWISSQVHGADTGAPGLARTE